MLLASNLSSLPTPLTYVGHKYQVFSGVDGSFTLTGFTGGIDSNLREGDLVFITLAVAANWTVTGVTDGFTFVGSQVGFNPGYTPYTVPFAYKIMGATPDTSVNFTGSGSGGTDAIAFAFRGADLTTPLDGVTPVSDYFSSSGEDTDPPAITTATDGAAVLTFGTGILSSSPPSGMETIFGPLGALGKMAAAVARRPTAGFINYGAWPSSEASTSRGDVAWTFSIRPQCSYKPFNL